MVMVMRGTIVLMLAILCIALASLSAFSAGINDTEILEVSSLRRLSSVVMTCDKFPRVCKAKGSAGPDCCKKKCVNVKTDSLNCGQCGKKCRYREACCSGKCVNVMYDAKNCGGCKKKCTKGSYCVLGMCSYA